MIAASKISSTEALKVIRNAADNPGKCALRGLRDLNKVRGQISLGMHGISTARRALAGVFACLVCLLVLVPAAFADDFSNVLSVQFADGATARERAQARASVDASYLQSLAAPGLQQIEIPRGDSADAAAMALRAKPAVEFVSVSGTWSIDSDDTYFERQWSLRNLGQVFMTDLSANPSAISGTPGADIGAVDAWTEAQLVPGFPGSEPEVIGVIDTGVAYQHEDLAANIVDGYDFFDDDDDPRDPNGHGTHVASMAAAVAGNGTGIAGANPWAKIMPLRAGGENGQFAWAAIEAAASNAIEEGVRIFNGSFSGDANNPAFEQIIAENPDVLFFFSAGNGGTDKIGDDHESGAALAHRYPCDLELDNIICVGASDWNDKLGSFSDFGVKSVDVVAPGARVFGAEPCLDPFGTRYDEFDEPVNADECPVVDDPEGGFGMTGGSGAYQLLTGTSMASPQVAGAAALIWEAYPDLSSAQVKRALVTTVDTTTALRTKVAWGGRVDAGRAIIAAGQMIAGDDQWPVPPAQPVDPPTPPDSGGGVVVPTTPLPEKPLHFTVIKPRVAKIGRSKRIKFKLRCTAVCSAAVSVRPDFAGIKNFKGKLRRGSAGTRAVNVTVPRRTLKILRRQLRSGQKPKLFFSVVVKDRWGSQSLPAVFTVRLSL